MDLNKELLHLRKLMEEGRITLLKSMAEPLRNVKQNSDGTVVESSVSGSIRALLLAIRAAEDGRLEFGDIDEKFLEKMMAMGKEEREKYFLSLPREKAAGYKEIYMRVMQLEDIFFIIYELPEEAFKSKFNKGMIGLGGNPADILRDYIILEIKKFYELAYKEKLTELLPLPEYWAKLKDFRDSRIAHPSKGCDFKLNEDVEKLYRVIDEIGLDKIMEDFKKYAKICIEHVSKVEEDLGQSSE
jgi:hypothetical protein